MFTAPLPAQHSAATTLTLGDVIVRNEAGAVFRFGQESVSFSPTGAFDRAVPLQLAFELTSPRDRPAAITIMRLVGNAGRDSLPALSIRFPSPVDAGVSTVRHEVDLSQLRPGRFRLDIVVSDSADGITVSRGTLLRIR